MAWICDKDNGGLSWFVSEIRRFAIEKYIWEGQKNMSTYYKLELRTYCSSPVLNWDVMLKMTGIVLDLMTDIDMHQFIEKGMGDVASYIEQR